MIGIIIKNQTSKKLSLKIESHPIGSTVLLKGDLLRIFENDLSECLEEGDRVKFELINQKGKGIFAYVVKKQI